MGSVAAALTARLFPDVNPYDEDHILDRFTVNRKSKMINTYSKSPRNGNQSKALPFTGSLSDRLQLIDTTPTGEDPYQLGEDDMREQSPIPKLMLQKTHQGRMRICATDTKTPPSNRHLYASPPDEGIEKIKLNRYNLTNTYMHPSEIKKEEPDLEDEMEFTKTEPQIDWGLYSQPEKPKSVCDFSYGETNSLAVNPVQIKAAIFGRKPLYPPQLGRFATYKGPNEKRRVGRTTSLVVAHNTPVSYSESMSLDILFIYYVLRRLTVQYISIPTILL